MKNFKSFLHDHNLTEALKQYSKSGDHAVMTFGDFSTLGDQEKILINAVHQHAKQVNGDPHIFISDKVKEGSPLSAKEKSAILKMHFPEVKKSFHSSDKESPSIYHSLSDLHKKGYKHASVILSDEDQTEMRKRLHQFNGLFDSNGTGYNFKSLNVMSKYEVNPSSGDRPQKIEGSGE